MYFKSLITFFSPGGKCSTVFDSMGKTVSSKTAVGHYFWYFGLSGVRALPLAAGINVVAIVLGIISLSSFSLLSSEALTFLPERRQLGFQIFVWLLTNKTSSWGRGFSHLYRQAYQKSSLTKARTPIGTSGNLIFIRILLFLLLRCPCKIT